MQKKGWNLLFVSLVCLALLGVVSAQGVRTVPSTPVGALSGIAGGFNGLVNGIITVFEPVLHTILGPELEGDFFFAKILFMLIIFCIVWVALSRNDFFNEYTWVLVVVTTAVSILATRWIASPDIIQTIILPYSAFGIVISAGLPFVLYFLIINLGFKEPQHRFFRKAAWIFFAVVFVGLWFARYDLILQAAQTNSAEVFPWIIYIYPITAALALVVAFMDGSISRFFFNMELQKVGADDREEAIAVYKRKIAELTDDVNKGVYTETQAEALKRRYERRIKWISKQLH